jgi:hypothetical protein
VEEPTGCENSSACAKDSAVNREKLHRAIDARRGKSQPPLATQRNKATYNGLETAGCENSSACAKTLELIVNNLHRAIAAKWG